MIDDFIKKDYQKLLRISRKYCSRTQLPSIDLVSELIIYLYESEEKVNEYINSESSLIRFCNKWLWQQTKVFTQNRGMSNFKSKFQLLERAEVGECVGGVDASNFYINEDELDLLRVYTEEQVRKIQFTKEYIKTFSEADRRLFHLHYIEGMSNTTIANYLQEKYGQKVSPSSIYKLIVQLRQKIKMGYGTSNN